MKKSYTILLIFILMLYSVQLYTQNNYRFSQIEQSESIINNGFVGKNERSHLFYKFRQQWLNIEGAPKNHVIIYNSTIKDKNLGLGLEFISENIGLSKTQSLNGKFAYHIKFDETKLAFGISLGANFINIDYTQLENIETSDPKFNVGIENYLKPSASIGFLWYSHRWYIGIDIPQLFTNAYPKNSSFESTTETNDKQWHYYIIGSYNFPIYNTIAFKPIAVYKLIYGAPNQLDLNANFILKETYLLGIGYHFNDAINFNLMFYYQNLYFGYAYNLTIGKLSAYQNGSHEITLGYNLISRKNKTYSPRFF
ncbi:MAG: PorP/SprF family type IX secretion system membrane protein [Bacteroidales bacterium]|nr:PorP/SprF family type IX secretion system membrane protein [Bacteroidales bacterium]